MIKIFSSLFYITIMLAINLQAQNRIAFDHLTIENGLSQSSVTCILQDSKGFMWFGTQDGLNRYDGYNFKVFKNNPSDSTSLSENFIFSIYEDKAGTLYIQTISGNFQKYRPRSESFVMLSKDSIDVTEFKVSNVNAFLDEPKYSWQGNIGTETGLKRTNKKTGEVTQFKHNPLDPQSISDNKVYSIFRDRSGNLWVGTFNGLDNFDEKTEKFTHYRNNPTDPNSISDNWVWPIFEDSRGILWIGTVRGGLNRFDSKSKTFTNYVNDPSDPTSLNDNYMFSIYEDRGGSIWIGTNSGGINYFHPASQVFERFINSPKDKNSLCDNVVLALHADKEGNYWIGTRSGGLDKFDYDRRSFTNYSHNPAYPNSLINNSVQIIMEDRSGVLWLGTFSSGMNSFNPQTGNFKRFVNNPSDPNSLSDNRVYSILEDSEGIIWIGTYGGGLNKLDKKTGKIFVFKKDKKNISSISSNYVWSIDEDNFGQLWLGTYGGGINIFNRTKQTFTSFKNNPKDSSSICDDIIIRVFKDSKNNMWFGTTKGLSRYNRKTNNFKNYREKDGLSNDFIYGILEDNNGYLWLSTNNGLSRFDPRTESFRNYYSQDGLQGNEFNQNAFAKDDNTGRLLFGGPNGFNVFDPNDVKENSYIPPIVYTNYSRYNSDDEEGKPIFEKGISHKDTIVLNYKDKIITLQFAALSYYNNSENQYRYNLEGFNENWIQLGNNHTITFTNLSPGNYNLRVIGSNNDGVWNEEGASIKIIISPPFWATWWAYGFYILFGLSVVYSIRRYEMNRLKLKNQVKLDEVVLKEREETDKMKSSFFANISHEFRTPLTLILGPTEKIIANYKDEELRKQTGLIKRNANRLLGLINQLLDLSKLEAGKLKLKTTPSNIVSFVKGITMSFESVAEQKDIALKVKSEHGEIEVYFDREMMIKILTNLLSNAFKFTPEGGEITVSLIEISDGLIEIRVKDTGIGISEEELPKLFDRFYQVDSSQKKDYEGSGLGLALTKELVELHYGKIKVESKKGEGSEFILELRLGRNHFSENEIFEVTEITDGSRVFDENIFTMKTEVIEKEIPTNLNDDRNIILVVEDNADVRNFIKDSLGNEFIIEEAANGEQGLRKAEQIIPDLIISDIMMPIMDGIELTRRLKSDEKTSHIPVILLTAKSGQENKLEGLETGADDYLIKPFDTKELQARIRNLINSRRKLQEKYSSKDFITPKRGEENLSRLGEAKAGKLSSLEEKFMGKVLEVIENHFSEEEFSIEQFGKEAGMSRVQLHRKLKALTGKSASHYLRSVRLSKAKKMIEEKEGNISEIGYAVGFSSPQYFTRCFKEEFGYPPSEVTR